MLRSDDDLTDGALRMFESRGLEHSDAMRFAAQQRAQDDDAKQAELDQQAREWVRSQGLGDALPSPAEYDYARMLADQVYPQKDGAGRVPLPPQYWKPGNLLVAGMDLATGRRVSSRAPLEDRVLGLAQDDDDEASDIRAILSAASDEHLNDLPPTQRRALEAWMEHHGVMLADASASNGTATDVPPGQSVARVGRAGVPRQPVTTKTVTEPATALWDALAGGLKGAFAQTLGLPGDIEALVRMLTGTEDGQHMVTTEGVSALLPDVTTDPARKPSAAAGQFAGELGGLGGAPTKGMKAAVTGARALAPTAVGMAERIAGKVGNSFRNYVVPYENAPDNLMGFPKGKPTKSFWDQKYRHVQFVRVRWADGLEIVDAVKGVNGPQAMERARRNWKDASEIVPLTREDAFKADPELKTLMESMGQ